MGHVLPLSLPGQDGVLFADDLDLLFITAESAYILQTLTQKHEKGRCSCILSASREVNVQMCRAPHTTV